MKPKPVARGDLRDRRFGEPHGCAVVALGAATSALVALAKPANSSSPSNVQSSANHFAPSSLPCASSARESIPAVPIWEPVAPISLQTVEGGSEERFGRGRIARHLLDDGCLLGPDLRPQRQPELLELRAAARDEVATACRVAPHGFQYTALDGRHHAHLVRSAGSIRDCLASLER